MHLFSYFIEITIQIIIPSKSRLPYKKWVYMQIPGFKYKEFTLSIVTEVSEMVQCCLKSYSIVLNTIVILKKILIITNLITPTSSSRNAWELKFSNLYRTINPCMINSICIYRQSSSYNYNWAQNFNCQARDLLHECCLILRPFLPHLLTE